MKKTVTLEAIAQMVAPHEKAEVVSAVYDADTRKFTIEWEDIPLRPLFVLETEAFLSDDQAKALRAHAAETLGDRYQIVVLAHGLKGKVIPASLLKAD